MTVNMNMGLNLNFLSRMPMLRTIGLGLGLGLMSPACSSPSGSSVVDSGYHPSVDAGLNLPDGGHDGGRDAGSDAADAGMLPPLTIERVSVGASGVQANNGSGWPSIGDDGRYLAFASYASNLVPSDTNGGTDVFVRDRMAGTTERVSVGSGSVEGNESSITYLGNPTRVLSSDGRFVTFASSASNFVSGDTNGVQDIFVRDRAAGTTQRVSVSTSGAQSNGFSDQPSISSDGQHVVFSSEANNLLAGDTNGYSDIFIRNLVSGMTDLVSVSGSNTQANALSRLPVMNSDGNIIIFSSSAGNLVSGDTNSIEDAFLRIRSSGITQRVSIGTGGVQANGSGSLGGTVSADGRYIAFISSADNLISGDTNTATDVFVYDRLGGTTERISLSSTGVQGNGGSFSPSISGDGRFVAFESDASNLVTGDTNGTRDIFVRDRVTGKTVRISVNASETQANGMSQFASMSRDGRFVAFVSAASNLISGDTNDQPDVFVVGLDHFFVP